jgi:hypothetical protein
MVKIIPFPTANTATIRELEAARLELEAARHHYLEVLERVFLRSDEHSYEEWGHQLEED